MSDDLHLDGNGVAGLLAEVATAEPTLALRRCQSCNHRNALGAHRAYRGAGVAVATRRTARRGGCGRHR